MLWDNARHAKVLIQGETNMIQCIEVEPYQSHGSRTKRTGVICSSTAS